MRTAKRQNVHKEICGAVRDIINPRVSKLVRMDIMIIVDSVLKPTYAPWDIFSNMRATWRLKART